jgi:hypothetical protein
LRLCASLEVPALPGAQKTAVTSELSEIFQMRACSRAPEPSTNIRIS